MKLIKTVSVGWSRDSRSAGSPRVVVLSLVLLLLCSCGRGAQVVEDKNRSEEGDGSITSAVGRLRETGESPSKDQILQLLGHSNLADLDLNASDAFFLAKPLSQAGLEICTCALYRRAISVELENVDLKEIRDKPIEYNRLMLIIRRSVEQCEDQRSLVLQSLLASIQGHGHTTLSILSRNSQAPDTQLALAISSWYRNKFEEANGYFEIAARGIPEYGEFLTGGSAFAVQLDASRGLDRLRSQLTSDRIDLPLLETALARSTQRRTAAIRNLIIPDAVGVALIAAEGVEHSTWVSKGAKVAKDVLFLMDIIEAFEAHEQIVSLESRRRSIVERRNLSVGRLRDFESSLSGVRIDINQLGNLVQAILLRGSLALEYLDEKCR